MKKFILPLFIVLLISAVIILNHTHQPASTPQVQCPFLVPANGVNGSVIASFDDTLIIRSEGKFFMKSRTGTYMINSSEAYFFPWGFVVSEEGKEVFSVPKYVMNYGEDPEWGDILKNISIENTSYMIKVNHLIACDYGGKILWKHIQPLSYLWEIKEEGVTEKSGESSFQIYTHASEEYFFMAKFLGKPRYHFGPDWLYIYNKNGLVKEIKLGEPPEPPDRVFFTSNGSYTLLGFNLYEGDGTPYGGRIMIFNGSEVIFDKFISRNDCLCYPVHGWGQITLKGCARFGMLEGVGTYCNGTFTYEKE